MIAHEELPRLLPRLPLVVVRKVCHRVIKAEYLGAPPPGAPSSSPPQPLWPGGARVHGARYTPIGGPPSLYLASDPVTALAEVRAVLPPDMRANGPHDPLMVIAVRVSLPHVLDLCDPDIQRALDTSCAELMGPWLRAQVRHQKGRGPLPLTQALGFAAAGTGSVLGLRYPSAPAAGAQNVVVFTDHLAALGGTVETVDSSGKLLQRLP